MLWQYGIRDGQSAHRAISRPVSAVLSASSYAREPNGRSVGVACSYCTASARYHTRKRKHLNTSSARMLCPPGTLACRATSSCAPAATRWTTTRGWWATCWWSAWRGRTCTWWVTTTYHVMNLTVLHVLTLALCPVASAEAGRGSWCRSPGQRRSALCALVDLSPMVACPQAKLVMYPTLPACVGDQGGVRRCGQRWAAGAAAGGAGGAGPAALRGACGGQQLPGGVGVPAGEQGGTRGTQCVCMQASFRYAGSIDVRL